MDQHVRADGDVLGVGAAVREAEDAVAHFEVAVRVRVDRVHDAGELDAEMVGPACGGTG